MMTLPVLLKRSDKMDTMTPRKVTNGDRSGSHEHSKGKRASTPFDYLCDPLRSPFVTHTSTPKAREIFATIPVMSSSCPRFFLSLFVFSLSSLFLVICEDRWERRKLKKIKRLWRHIEISMMTQLVSLERSWRN